MNDDLTVEISLEEELEPKGDMSHLYVICNICSPKVVNGVILETVCGKLLRFHENCPAANCPDCNEIRRVTPNSNMLPCTLCGHKW